MPEMLCESRRLEELIIYPYICGINSFALYKSMKENEMVFGIRAVIEAIQADKEVDKIGW